MDVKSYGFDAKKTKDELVAWIKAWFNENGPECPAVIGIKCLVDFKWNEVPNKY